MDKPSFVLRYEKILVFITIVLVILGIRAYLTTPQSIFPPMSFARVDVVIEAGDLPADQVRIAITRPFEQAFQSLPAVSDVLATSSQGSADLRVTFFSNTSPQVDLQYVDQAIAQIRNSVPAANAVTATIVNPSSEPVLSYALTSSSLSQAVLREIAQTQILPKLYGIAGMGRITINGGPTTEFHVVLDAAKLRAHNLSAAQVGQFLTVANAVHAVGNTQQFYQRYALVVSSSFSTIDGLRNNAIPLKNGSTVPLASLGQVELGVSPITDETSLNAQHAVMINVYATANADTVTLATEFRTRIDRLRAHLPQTMKLTSFWDQTTLIQASQTALRDAIILGALLAIIVIYVFLRNLRLTLIAALIIPIAMAITVFALPFAGQSLNLMSVGGLAVAVGLIIDDVIVVIENISRNAHAAPDEPFLSIVVRSMRQITGAMIASTSTTVVIFLPLALLTGVSGFFFRALAFTLAVSLLVSLALALVIAPILARRLLTKASIAENHRDGITTVLERYESLLRWTLHHRPVIWLGSIVTLVATVFLLSTLQSDFLPKMDEGQLEISYTMPTGTTLAASDASATIMEQIVAHDAAVASVGRLTGIDANGLSPTPLNHGFLRVRLVDAGRRDTYEVVSERLRRRLETAVPAALFDFHQMLEDIINDLSGSASPIVITLQGNDQARLIHLANELRSRLSKIPGIVDASNGVVYDNPSLLITPNLTTLAAGGLSLTDLADYIQSRTQGAVITSIPFRDQLLPLRLLVHDPLPLMQSLGMLATVTPIRLASDITTKNGQRSMLVTANVQGASLSQLSTAIQQLLHDMPLPPGYTSQVGGQIETQQESFSNFMTVIALAIISVYAVMLTTFRSLRLPLVILTTIPLALIGVALALRLTGTAFNVSSFMGLLLLVGIVVKNGILLIDVANVQRAQGETLENALIIAGKTRLRPIVMTTLAAIGGLTPLALGIGQGAEMEQPLAIAVIGGLSTATIFTLVVIPLLYAALSPKTPVVDGRGAVA